MNKCKIFSLFNLLIILVLVLLFNFSVQAGQTNKKSPQEDTKYESELETIKGEILEVDKITPKQKGMKQLTNINIKFNGKSMLVLLGPSAYLEENGIKLSKGDVITIKGFTIPHPPENIFAAVKIEKDDKNLKLLDYGRRPLIRKVKK
jgi:hypothetical protein